MNLEEYIRPYNKLLNIVLQKKFKWFEKIELDDLKYGGVRGQKNFINPVGKIYVDSNWVYKQWREYHYDTPFYYDEELNFGDIIGGDLSEEIQKQFKICFSQVVGEFIPKYMSFSWLTVVLVDKKEDTIKETIRRILREETEPNKANLVRKMIHRLYDNVSFIEQSTFNGKPHLRIYFDSDDTAANIESWFDEKIYRDINELTSGIITVCPDWAARWDSRKKEADVYINTELLRYDNLGNVINESSKSIRRILKEEDYSPAGKEIIPNKIVVHKSNPMFRDKILEDGLKVRAGECYKIYVGYGIKCRPAIFATNSTNKRAWFDSTYDDDVWEINTEMIPDVKWFKDRHYESRSKHIVTFQDIPAEAITLKYKGTGSGDVRTWDKDSPNIVRESIRRILREELSKEPFVTGVWGDGDNNYSIDRLVKLVKDRKPTTMSIDKIINKNSDLETKEGNFKENIKKPTKLFKQRTMKANTEYPVMISEEGWIIDGSHRIAKQRWDGIKKVKVHVISKEDLKKCKITDPKELKKSKEIKY